MPIHNINSPDEISGSFSFFRMLVIYLVICGIGVSMLLTSFNLLIRSHDKKLTGDICSLVTEKMNNSIRYMTSSAENMSAALSAQDHYDLQALYDTLSRDTGSRGYVSIGFIDQDDNIYATPSELSEFDKWGLLDTAKLADPVSISAPYRSGATGQPVFTMFANFTYGGGKKGYLFLTNPLKEIQNMAYTESVTEDTEIWLMEAASDNIIQCAGSNSYSIGSWNNALLSMRMQINYDYQDEYIEWKNKMDEGHRTANTAYKIGSETYTQVFSRINYMHGWYVVVRIPSSSLSAAMQQFRTSVLIFLGILLIATIIMFLLSHKRETEEKRVLQNLSIYDPLTSVMNRRAFDFTAEKYLGRILKNEASLLFIDVDYFKQVNDRFGHDAGDRILTEFSAALTELFGEDSYISRYGGDEFVVLVRSADKKKVSKQLDILQAMAKEVKPCDDPEEYGDFVLTFSCGAAVSPKDAEDLKSLEACADDALYIVKKNGRNGYRWYEKAADVSTAKK
ncbi:MAG: GGDEF domain-containing protein [Oscillospiraceae bacterium]|nr:GGDEF domain-containing protein [Oscillospiraceae bacterium]